MTRDKMSDMNTD